MISLTPLIAGFGPLGLPELLIISVLIFIVLAPIVIAFGLIYYFTRRKSAPKTNDEPMPPLNQTED
ncbi:MAG: hypothetical protein NTV80_07925 [Verrucomicrobia bacterium]|nr:hypothetical protein [Verrucomicrobiota bacterium]